MRRNPERSLKRSLSLPMITLYGLGTTIGAGIYVLIGKVAGSAGLYAPVSFAVSALLAGLTVFSFAEFSSRLPRSAGEAVYVHAAFPVRWLALIVGGRRHDLGRQFQCCDRQRVRRISQ